MPGVGFSAQWAFTDIATAAIPMTNVATMSSSAGHTAVTLNADLRPNMV